MKFIISSIEMTPSLLVSASRIIFLGTLLGPNSIKKVLAWKRAWILTWDSLYEVNCENWVQFTQCHPIFQLKIKLDFSVELLPWNSWWCGRRHWWCGCLDRWSRPPPPWARWCLYRSHSSSRRCWIKEVLMINYSVSCTVCKINLIIRSIFDRLLAENFPWGWISSPLAQETHCCLGQRVEIGRRKNPASLTTLISL